jgi:predicted HAD superfamily hydrolase
MITIKGLMKAETTTIMWQYKILLKIRKLLHVARDGVSWHIMSKLL